MSEYEQDVAEVVELIEKATADDLTGPEWQLNLMICDAANANAAICDDIVRTLQKRMQTGSVRVIQQTLVLAETLVKNGSTPIHTQIGSRAFLQEIAAVTDGSMGFDVQNKALELIKQWADAFAGSSLTTFQDTYRMLKIHGVVFPESENDVPVFTPPASAAARPQHQLQQGSSRSVVSTGSTGTARSTRQQQIAKLHADLDVVKDKISAYRDFKERGQYDREAMEDVVDFLRQCQPRMNALIEGGIMGKLDEKTLEACLNVNDHLIKVLEDAKTSRSPSPSPRAAADLITFDSPQRKPTPSSRQADLLDDMASFSLGGNSPAPAPTRSAHGHVQIRSNPSSSDDVLV